ncbi:MAG TPA: hypothetical protein VEA80_11735 [Vitreimonas sp.]|uniref:hypothetical protein n=1 Tax=Vitreimonas sp. TaxID=3069702 RepID=UPI002D4F5737|nr:hypothetical protein [Vitreimonas sp.]HYD88140.1 hypothetical protein [Vitreimonas sp.]
MKNFLMSAMALAAFAIPGVAAADDVSDRTEAIRLCRAEVSSQAGLDIADVRLDQVRVRGTSIRVELDVWRDGDLQNVRCDVARNRGEVTIASISPAIQTASAQPAAATE